MAAVLAKILGVIGRLMIGAGVLILLFVAYQLWGTGLQTQAAQNDLRTEFDQQLAEARAQADAAGSTTTSTTTEPVAPVSTLPDGTAENPGDLGRPAEEADLGIQWGDPIGRILIDKIGVDFVYIEGVELSLLQDGPGHFPETSFPGQPGNAALAGHRTTFMAPFNRIDELSAGDLVQVETVQGTFTYEVMAQPDGLGHRIVGPDAIEITEDKGDDRLTLMACHPKYSAAQRIVVEAKLVGNPAAKTKASEPGDRTELPSLGEGGDAEAQQLLASCDPAARLPALLWSAAALAAIFVAWLIGHLWRKARWPVYLVSLPIVGLLLWHAFEWINRALPGAY